MITVVNNQDYISANGHAGSGTYPNDICCECFGLLCQQLLYSLQDIAKETPQYQLTKGHFYINKKTLSYRNPATRILFESFALGCELLQQGYPDNIRVLYPDQE